MGLTLIEAAARDGRYRDGYRPSRYRYTRPVIVHDRFGGYRPEEKEAEIEIADGPLRRNDPDDLPLTELWTLFTSACQWHDRQRTFLDYLRLLGATAEVAFCWNCNQPEWGDKLSPAMGGAISVCASCYDSWADCGSCENRYRPGDLTSTLDSTAVCAGCRDDYYAFCGDCDGYYHNEDAPAHRHSANDGCCSSPQLAFTVRNDGREPLANDTQATVTLPEGQISDEGLQAIRDYLCHTASLAYRNAYTREEMAAARALQALSRELSDLGSAWQTRAGNYTKRLSRHAYASRQLKIDPAVLSQVGCIARDHSKSVSVTIDVTRQLNEAAAYFYHSDSCWWGLPGGYADSRCAFKTNGGFGLRSLSPYGGVTGRAWVLPLRLNGGRAGCVQRLVPTFETLTPDALVVFNGYGELSSYTAPRIMAHLTGWTYSRIDFACSPMYINSGGYLVAPEETVQQVKTLDLSVHMHSNLFEREQAEKARLVAGTAATEKETADVRPQ